MAPTILSIQSSVCTGHVGNAAAVFPLQRLGAEVWPVHTVQFSNHPGHGSFTGRVFPGADTRALVDGIAARGLLGGCHAVLSGYMGDADTGHAVLHAAALVKRANPAALYCCDPVIGDVGKGRFVRDGIAELLAGRAVAASDVLTPNQWELEFLAGHPCPALPELMAAVRGLQDRMAPGGRGTVLVTSVAVADTPDGWLDLVAADRAGGWRLRVEKLPVAFSGAGDLIAALFLLHLLRSGSAGAALEEAGSAVAGVLRATAAAGAAELLLVEAQGELVAPSRRYRAAAL